jgi:hypothetical protein
MNKSDLKLYLSVLPETILVEVYDPKSIKMTSTNIFELVRLEFPNPVYTPFIKILINGLNKTIYGIDKFAG